MSIGVRCNYNFRLVICAKFLDTSYFLLTLFRFIGLIFFVLNVLCFLSYLLCVFSAINVSVILFPLDFVDLFFIIL